MQHYRQWSAVFASYFAISGLWTSFGPSALMATHPGTAPAALAAITLAYFVSPPFAHRLWQTWGFNQALLGLSSGVFASLALAAIAPGWLIWCAPLAFFFGSGTYTLCETRMLEDLAHQGRGHEFGRARKWGSSGFLIAATLGGAAFSVLGVGRSFELALAACAGVFLLCCIPLWRALQAVNGAAAQPVGPALSADTVRDGASRTTSDTTSGASPLAPGGSPPLTRRQQWSGCAAVAAMRLAEAVSTTWFGAYWLHSGHDPFQTGLLCALPVASEFLAMWKGASFLARFSASAVMLICCALSAVRWLATPYCSTLWCAVPLQSLHAFTFGFFYPASLVWLKHSFGARFFHVRYVTESVARALTAATTFVAAGWVIARFGYGSLYAMSLLMALSSGLWWLHTVRRASA